MLFETLILPSEEFAKNMKKYRGNFSYISQDIAYIILYDSYRLLKDSSSKIVSGLFVYINRETGSEEVDLKAMKYTLNAFETYFEKYPDLVDKSAVFLKVIWKIGFLVF